MEPEKIKPNVCQSVGINCINKKCNSLRNCIKDDNQLGELKTKETGCRVKCDTVPEEHLHSDDE